MKTFTPKRTTGLRVEVYWNFHKKRFSVRALKGSMRGLVCLHAEKILLENVEFTVQPSGRARVLREGRKNVHAFVRGTLVATDDGVGRSQDLQGWDPVTYNPYLDTSFVRVVGETGSRFPVQTASHFLGIVEAGAAECRVPSMKEGA